MRAHEAFRPFVNAAAGTVSDIEVEGGVYVLDFSGTGAGTVDLFRLMPNGSSYLSVMTQITATSATSGALTLPPGLYRVTVAGFTANYVTLARIPGE